MEPLFHLDDREDRVTRRSLWSLLFIVAVVALVAVMSFGAGIVAERQLFGGALLGSGRLLGGLDNDAGQATDEAFPRQAQVRALIDDEYFFLPASPEAQATFWADSSRRS